MFSLLFLLSSNFDTVFSQSQLDSLEMFNPFTSDQVIRKIIDRNFSILGTKNEIYLSNYRSLLVQAEKNGSTNQINEILLKIGDIYFAGGIYNSAIQYYSNVLKNYEEQTDSLNIALTKVKIGRSYYFADASLWRDSYKDAALILNSINTKKYAGYKEYLNALIETDTAKQTELFGEALRIQKKVMKEHPDDIKVKEQFAIILNANYQCEAAITIAEEIGDKWLSILYLNNYGYAKENEGNYNEAIRIYTKALRICKEERFKTLLRNIYENLSNVYRLKGEWKKAVEYLQLVRLVEESLFNENIARDLSEAKIKYEAEKKELENIYLKKEKHILDEKIIISRNLNIALFILFVVSLVVFLLGFFSKRKMKTAYTLLDAKNNENIIQKTELLKLNETLQQSEKNLKEAQATAQLANWELDLEKKELNFSDQFSIIFPSTTGSPKNNLENIMNLVLDEDKTLAKSFFLGHSTNDVEFRICENNTIKWIKAQKGSSGNVYNRSVRIFGTVQDITNLKEKEKIEIEMATQKLLTKQLIQSQEQERKRIASELHDSLGQDILIIKNRVLLGLQNEAIDKYSLQHLEEINNLVSSVLEEVREISFNLRPAHLERLGLTETIISTVRKFELASSIAIETEVDNIDGLLSNEHEMNLFRILQEGLSNTLKHANAKNASVRIFKNPDSISLAICDDGRGFDYNFSKEKSFGFGLKNIYNRTMLLNGKFEVKSKHSEGTCLEIIIPV